MAAETEYNKRSTPTKNRTTCLNSRPYYKKMVAIGSYYRHREKPRLPHKTTDRSSLLGQQTFYSPCPNQRKRSQRRNDDIR